MSLLRRGALGLLLPLLGCLTPRSASAQVQMTRGPQNHLLVPVQVNGRPATFVLDTGMQTTVLQANRAAAFGVRQSGEQVQMGKRTIPAGQVGELRVGAVGLGALQVGLYEPAQFRGPVPGKGGQPADGLLGLDVLRRYRAVINCRTQQLFFRDDTAARLKLAATTRAMGFSRIELNQTGRGYVSAPCSIRGKPGALYIDTGAFITVLNKADVRALQLPSSPSKLTARTAAGRVGQLELVRVEDLRIGEVRIPPQRLAVMDLFPDRKPVRAFTGMGRLEFYDMQAMRARRGIWGLLGPELLYQHHAIIDFEGMSLFLK